MRKNIQTKFDVILRADQINITPDQPVIMSGYDARKTPSTGVHDSLFASALFFFHYETNALLISDDMIGFPSAFVDTVKNMISAKTRLRPNNIMIIATHDHVVRPFTLINLNYRRQMKSTFKRLKKNLL